MAGTSQTGAGGMSGLRVEAYSGILARQNGLHVKPGPGQRTGGSSGFPGAALLSMESFSRVAEAVVSRSSPVGQVR